LFFAGEAMNLEHAGTVHGAIISGEEASRDVLNYARHRKQTSVE
jgi:hypothetical protein